MCLYSESHVARRILIFFTGFSFYFRLKKPQYSSVSALSLPTISSWKNMSFEKRFVNADVLNRVPLRHQTKQRHLQRDEVQLLSSCSMEDRVFRSSHEMYCLYRLLCLLLIVCLLQCRVVYCYVQFVRKVIAAYQTFEVFSFPSM